MKTARLCHKFLCLCFVYGTRLLFSILVPKNQESKFPLSGHSMWFINRLVEIQTIAVSASLRTTRLRVLFGSWWTYPDVLFCLEFFPLRRNCFISFILSQWKFHRHAVEKWEKQVMNHQAANQQHLLMKSNWNRDSLDHLIALLKSLMFWLGHSTPFPIWF